MDENDTSMVALLKSERTKSDFCQIDGSEGDT
jgi:hypothetical protein